MENQDKLRMALKRCRRLHGISQNELAKAAGMSQPAIGNFEAGLFNLSAASFDRVRRALLRLIDSQEAAAQVSRQSLSSGEMQMRA